MLPYYAIMHMVKVTTDAAAATLHACFGVTQWHNDIMAVMQMYATHGQLNKERAIFTPFLE